MYQPEEKTYKYNPNVSSEKFWFALYTKPRHEFQAGIYLDSIDIEYYLPTITTVRKWSDRKKKVTEPLIRGYILVYCNEKERYDALQHESILNTVCFEGKPARIPEWQIENLKKLLAENREVFLGDLIPVGTKVKIVDGPFAGVIGQVCQSDNGGKLLGVNIDLLRRSVLVRLPKESVVKEIKKVDDESKTVD